jgi:parallel beta-helix repeat protein
VSEDIDLLSLELAIGAGGSSHDRGTSIATDSADNVVVAGTFNGTADFNPGTELVTVDSNGNNDVFVSKYDSTGKLIWVISIGGRGQDYVSGIAIDREDNVLITGQYEETADFEPGDNTTALTSAGGFDAFVAKYSPSGTLIWVISLGGTDFAGGNGIAVDNEDNIFVTGSFIGVAEILSGSAIAPLTSSGGDDGFIAKFDPQGKSVWAHAIGGPQDDSGNDIALDASGNVFITGRFKDTVDFNPGAESAALTSVGDYDIYLINFDKDGQFDWAVSAGSPRRDSGISVTADSEGNAIITGFFYETVDFDPGEGESLLTSERWSDIFVAKYDPEGDLIWAISVGVIEEAQAYGVQVDREDNIFVTGRFRGTADFDPSDRLTALMSEGEYDLFVAKYSAEGNLFWATSGGSIKDDVGFDLTTDSQNHVLVTGQFSEDILFGPEPKTTMISSAGSSDIFVAKYHSLETSTTTSPVNTIQDAVDRAVEGDVICLGPGNWEEEFVIDKSLTIKGAAENSEDVQLIGENGVLSIHSDGEDGTFVTLENFTVQNDSGAAIKIGGAASVSINNLKVTNLIQDRFSEAGIRISGDATVVITDSMIENSEAGVLAQGQAQVTIANITATRNTNGIHAEGEASVTVSDSTVSDNRQSGVFAHDSAQLTVTNLSVSGSTPFGVSNRRAEGIHLEGNAVVTMADIAITGVRFTGLWLAGNVQATVENLEIDLSDSSSTGLSLEGDAQASVTNASVMATGFGSVGLNVRGNAHITLQKTNVSFTGSASNGMILKHSARATIADSSISKNVGRGIWLSDDSQVDLTNVTLADNYDDGLFLGDNAVATVIDSTITGGRDYGVFLEGKAQATLTDVTISDNRFSGVFLGDEAQASLNSNVIISNGSCGIFSMGAATVSGTDNEMRDNGNDLCGALDASLRRPLALATESEIRWPDERFGSPQEAIDALVVDGVLYFEPGIELVTGMTLTKSVQLKAVPETAQGQAPVIKGKTTFAPVISIVAGVKVDIEGLTIEQGLSAFWVRGDAELVLTDTTISNNVETGVSLADSAQAVLNRVHISGNSFSYSEQPGRRGEGVFLTDDAQATLNDTTISDNPMGIAVSGNASIVLNDTTVSDNRWSFELIDNSFGTLDNVTVSGDSTGFWLKGSAQVTLTDTTISGSGFGGFLAQHSTKAHLNNVTLSGYEQGGIFLDGRSEATLTNVTISGIGGPGIFLQDEAQASISGVNISDNGFGAWLQGDSINASITNSTFSGNNSSGLMLEGNVALTLSDNVFEDHPRWGVELRGCDSGDPQFTGEVDGSGNTFSGNGLSLSEEQKQAGDGLGELCPDGLSFLKTEAGGQFPQAATQDTDRDPIFADEVIHSGILQCEGSNNYCDPTAILGEPDETTPYSGRFVALGGNSGSISVQMSSPFTDGDGPDLLIYEVGKIQGGTDELFDVDISDDGLNWIQVATSVANDPGEVYASVDIFPNIGVYQFIRIVDANPRSVGGVSPGVDIDAIEAHHTASADNEHAMFAAGFETSLGSFKAEIYANLVPITGENFRNLIEQGFYNGLVFHRVIEGFIIQTGDPFCVNDEGKCGSGGSSRMIPLEIVEELKHDTPGVLGMGRASNPDSATSHFYITLAEQSSLDGSYAVFGRVIEGLDVIQAIGSVDIDDSDRPVEDVVIVRAYIESQSP